MKRSNLVIFAMTLIHTGLAWAGTETGNGGDEDREFVMRVWRTSATHVERYQPRFPEIGSQVLSQVIENGPRPKFSDRQLNCDGITNSMACFDNQNGIVTFSRARFRAANEDEKIRISVHELFRLVHLDDSYDLSQRLLSIVSPAHYFDVSSQYCPRNRDYCEFERDVLSLNVFVLPGQEVSYHSPTANPPAPSIFRACFSIGGWPLRDQLNYNGGILELYAPYGQIPSYCDLFMTNEFRSIRFFITNPPNRNE